MAIALGKRIWEMTLLKKRGAEHARAPVRRRFLLSLLLGLVLVAMALLHACGGLQAFNRATGMAPMADAVARFLLYERAYPDSVAYGVDAAADLLERSGGERS